MGSSSLGPWEGQDCGYPPQGFLLFLFLFILKINNTKSNLLVNSEWWEHRCLLDYSLCFL